MQVSIFSIFTVVAFAMNAAANPVPAELLPRCSGVGTCGLNICKVDGCTCTNAGCLKESSRICTCA
ncbi:hypothetical protein F5B19DRAFT_472551 [Rostrohypoxylon terebratum]|nr:hypothetical protein F5B19DRAFT_472551 [Rostrohypoxylon terebratum]